MIFTEDTYDPKYYYPFLVTIIIFVSLIQIIIFYIKSSANEEEFDKLTTYSKLENIELSRKKDKIWFSYLMGFISARSSIWAKSPYIFYIFSEYQKFSIQEIGIFYAIDSAVSLFSGPIFGILADKFGRKKFSLLYPILNIMNLYFRMSSYKSLTYLSQILTGMGSGIIATIFESWFICEANKVLHNQTDKEKFVKKVFKTQNILDASASIIISSICAMSFVSLNLIFQ